MEFAYYPGCTLHASSALYDTQTKTVLARLGIALNELEDWSCCGATSVAKTDDFLAVAMAARNLGIAEASGLPGLVIPCSACYSRTLVSQKKLEADPELADEINAELTHKVAGTVKVMSILEALTPLAASGQLAEKATASLKGLAPACYYGCLQTRFPYDVPIPDDVENPRGMETILEALGASPPDWNFKTDCCGASASVNDTDTALRLMSRIMEDAVARGAQCFVTSCPFCQLNLDAYQEQTCTRFGIEKRLPVYFITELIGIALGLTAEELRIDRHFTEAIGLLKELKLS